MINKLDEAVSNLMSFTPFYGYWIIQSYRDYSDKIPTAAVVFNNKTFKLDYYFNRNFFDNLTEVQREKIIMHEVLHDVKGHYFWEGYDDKEIANMAMDIVINLICITDNAGHENRSHLPEAALYWDSFPNLNLKKNETEKYYYQELMKAKKKHQNEGSSGDENFDKIMKEGVNKSIKHDWEWVKDISNEEKEILKPFNNTKLNEAYEYSREKGRVPIEIKNIIEEIKGKSIIPWNKIFKQFVGSACGDITETTRKKPNRRISDYPGKRNIPHVKVLFAKDASGSMTDEDLAAANNELKHMAKLGIEIFTCQWDIECSDFERYNEKLEHIRLKSGGTNASCAIEKINKSPKKWDLVIIFTDGYIEDCPKTLLTPGFWVIAKNGNDNFKHHLKKIKMNY